MTPPPRATTRSSLPAVAARPWPWSVFFLCILGVGLIGWIDYVTGRDYSVALFYLLPVGASGWWVGHRGAALTAVTASLVWFTAAYARADVGTLPVSVWNGTMRLGIFLTTGLLAARVRDDQERLEALVEREARLARTDELTGLLNSRAFLEALDAEVARARRSAHSLCLVYLDLDNFKQVNDRYGHAAGDRLLARFAEALRTAMRATDVAARLGGDEFAVLLWDVPVDEVERVVERARRPLADLAAAYPLAAVGVSVGVAHFATPPADGEEALRRADAAMYDGKATGKGHVVVTRLG